MIDMMNIFMVQRDLNEMNGADFIYAINIICIQYNKLTTGNFHIPQRWSLLIYKYIYIKRHESWNNATW